MQRFIKTRAAALEVFVFGDGNGPLALCLHGFPEHAVSWRNQVSMLVDLGFCVWVPNLRGYGNSSRPIGKENYTVQTLCEDVVDLITASEKGDVVLIGHDWGATLTWFVALTGQVNLKGIIAVNGYHPSSWARLTSTDQILKSAYLLPLLSFPVPEVAQRLVSLAGLDSLLKTQLSHSVPPEIATVYHWNISQPGALTAMLNYYRASADPQLWNQQYIDARENWLDIPALVINGTDDFFIDPSMSDGIDTLGSDITAKTIEGGHWLPQQSIETTKQIRRWLQSRFSAGLA